MQASCYHPQGYPRPDQAPQRTVKGPRCDLAFSGTEQWRSADPPPRTGSAGGTKEKSPVSATAYQIVLAVVAGAALIRSIG